MTQIGTEAGKFVFGLEKKIKCSLVYGGSDVRFQRRNALGADIICATTGRLTVSFSPIIFDLFLDNLGIYST